MTSRRDRLRYAAELGILATVYVVVARLGLQLDAVAGFASLVWPATGLALAALLLRGYRLWPAIAAGAAVANYLTGAPVGAALAIGAGNAAEALVGAFALRSIPGFRPSLNRLRDVLGLIFFAAILSTAISATVGVTSLYLAGIVEGTLVTEAWRAWWLGDMIGALLVAPVILVWSAKRSTAPARRRLVESAALGVTVIGISVLVFSADSANTDETFAQAYMLFPVLMWAALRFGQRGAVTTAFLMSVIAVIGTALGKGPFAGPALFQSLFALQTFMGIAAATFLVVGASVSERRRAVLELREAMDDQHGLLLERDAAHRRLLAVLDQSPLGIAIVEAGTGRYIFANEEVTNLLGARPALIQTMDPTEGAWRAFDAAGVEIDADELPVVLALRGDTIRNEVLSVLRTDGHEIDLMVNAGPVRDAQGAIIAAVLIFWDVTAQRRADEELRLAHEATASANRAKADFFAVMSHELRTPLNAISGYVDLLLMGIEGGLTDKQRDSLLRIQRNQQHLLTLIDDVLSFARVEGGRLAIAVQNVPVRTAIAELEPLIDPALRQKNITYGCVECAEPLMVIADPEKLRQVLLNFLANAVKFTPEGGTITVGAEREGADVRIWVRDTGIGIPEDQLQHVFEPFFQVDRGTTRRYPGVGLGLSIARDLARAMGGDVEVRSTVGNGSTISIKLRAADTPAAGAAA